MCEGTSDIINKKKMTTQNKMHIITTALFSCTESYSIIKHIHWIDFNNFNVLEVCTMELYSLGITSIGSGLVSSDTQY